VGNTKSVFLLLVCGAMVALALSLFVGSVAIRQVPWHDLADSASLAHALVFDLRLPRALTAFACGGLLALAGALMQVLLRNPLADPFIMGVSGGAAIGALAAILLGWSAALIDSSAAVGALLATLVVFRLAHGEGGWTTARLLLTGVVVAAGASAVISLLLALSDDSRLRNMLFWLMGDVSLGRRGPWLLAILCVALALCVPFARHLNVLARGETQARILGAPVDALRIGIFIASSFLTALTVTTAGTIGFVGLVTPHLARLLLGSDHRKMLPAAVLLGGTLVTIADLAARTLFAPRQLPVGALTALTGVPLFLFLMRRVRS
jgi:iron complex transport system permease protein